MTVELWVMALQDLQKHKSVCQILHAEQSKRWIFSTLILITVKINFLSLAYGCRNNITVFDKFDSNGVSIFSFKKHHFVDIVCTLMLVYRKHFKHMQNFFQILNHLLAANSVDIVAGHFNFDLLKVQKNNLLLNHFMEHV